VTAELTIERGPHRGIERAEIKRRIFAMIKLLQLEKLEVSFLLTDDERIHQLNKVYRHKDRPTDVLAFAMREGAHGELAGDVLGDVIVSIPTARRQASERGAALVDEVTMLLAHGLLHLLGWDHDTAAKDRRMRAETDRLCAAAAPAKPARRPLAKRSSKAGERKAETSKLPATRKRGSTGKH
jgi:probable rRNA maturation factor